VGDLVVGEAGFIQASPFHRPGFVRKFSFTLDQGSAYHGKVRSNGPQAPMGVRSDGDRWARDLYCAVGSMMFSKRPTRIASALTSVTNAYYILLTFMLKTEG
jgi:hypothetical protein